MQTGRSPDTNGTSLPVGKLPPRLLGAQLERFIPKGERVLIGPRLGDDATVIDMGDRFLVCATDPVTLASERTGYYAVHINANDVAVMGATPLWYWATILLPEGKSDNNLVERIFLETRRACDELGVELCGGHTEITAGLTRPILSGFMAGEMERERLADKRNIRPGDDIILSRGVAIEGTATLAAEKEDLLSDLDPAIINRAIDLLNDPGISVVREALLAVKTGGVHGMHDPTEGGLWLGLRELAEVASVGLEVDEKEIVVLPETEAICGILDLDPKGLLASGSLLVVSDHESAARILDTYKREGIPARAIGRVREREFGIKLRRRGTLVPMPEIERDEITKVM